MCILFRLKMIGRGSFKVVHKAVLNLPGAPKPRDVAAMMVQAGDIEDEISTLLKLARHPRLATFIGQCKVENNETADRILLVELAPQVRLDVLYFPYKIMLNPLLTGCIGSMDWRLGRRGTDVVV